MKPQGHELSGVDSAGSANSSSVNSRSGASSSD